MMRKLCLVIILSLIPLVSSLDVTISDESLEITPGERVQFQVLVDEITQDSIVTYTVRQEDSIIVTTQETKENIQQSFLTEILIPANTIPGRYILEVRLNDETAQTTFNIISEVRLIDDFMKTALLIFSTVVFASLFIWWELRH